MYRAFSHVLQDGFIHRNMAQQPGVTDSVGADLMSPSSIHCGLVRLEQHRITGDGIGAGASS